MKHLKKCISLLLIFATLFGCLSISASAESHPVSFPAEGDYYILSEADSSYALDVSGGGNAPACTSIQLWEKNDTDAQIFTLTKVSGDWYKIVHKLTGQVVNVQNGNSYNDARLWLYPYDGTDACHFRFAAVGSSYVIQNKLDSQRVIDLHNAQSYNGAVVHLWDTHFGTSAKWKLVPVSIQSSPGDAGSYPVVFPTEGDYYILSEANNGYALDVNGGGDAPTYTSIQLWEKNDTDAQIFTLTKVSGDWYRIVHKRTGQVINVQNGNSYNDARLWLYPYDGTDACHFRFAAVGSSYVIQNKLDSQRVIDLHNAQSYSGAVVHLWDTHFGTSAKWKLVPVSSQPSSGGPLDNLGNINFIRQGSKTCKATALAMCLNLITGSNNYTTSDLGNSSCKYINNKSYTGFNGVKYTAIYKQDTYVGSKNEEINAIEASLAKGAPALAAVHSTSKGKTQHHWIVIVGKQGDDYLAVDPGSNGSGSMSNNVKTISSMGYAFGLADYNTLHYGYVTFK